MRDDESDNTQPQMYTIDMHKKGVANLHCTKFNKVDLKISIYNVFLALSRTYVESHEAPY